MKQEHACPFWEIFVKKKWNSTNKGENDHKKILQFLFPRPLHCIHKEKSEGTAQKNGNKANKIWKKTLMLHVSTILLIGQAPFRTQLKKPWFPKQFWPSSYTSFGMDAAELFTLLIIASCAVGPNIKHTTSKHKTISRFIFANAVYSIQFLFMNETVENYNCFSWPLFSG